MGGRWRGRSAAHPGGARTGPAGAATETIVGREAFFHGHLPPVCVKTGVPADGTVTAGFTRLPPWTFLLLLVGIVPFLIALLLAPERVRGEVPISRAALERYHGRRRWLWYGWGLAAAGVAGAVALQQPWLLAPTLAGVAVVTVTEVLRAFDWIQVRPVRGTPLVELQRVHPAFAAAVAASSAPSQPTG